MRIVLVLGIIFFVSSCNLAKWNQDRMTNKMERNEISELFFKNEKHKVHYFEGGEGETVLLIHGFGGDAQITWYKTMIDLVDDYHVIAPDLLWFGQSKSSSKPNLSAQVDAIMDLLKHSKVNKCAVAGISYGGFVTSGLVYSQPKMFSKVCMIDSPGVTYNVSLLDSLCKKQKVASVDEIFVVKNSEQLKALYALAFFKKPHMPKSILKDAYELYFADNHIEQTKLLHSLMDEQDRFLENSDFKFPPTCVLWGDNDRIFPISEGEKLAKFMKAEFTLINKAGHAPNIENFKDFEKKFRAFLEM